MFILESLRIWNSNLWTCCVNRIIYLWTCRAPNSIQKWWQALQNHTPNITIITFLKQVGLRSSFENFNRMGWFNICWQFIPFSWRCDGKRYMLYTLQPFYWELFKRIIYWIWTSQRLIPTILISTLLITLYCKWILRDFLFMHFYPGTITTQVESINSDLRLGLDRHLRHTLHWTQNRTI